MIDSLFWPFAMKAMAERMNTLHVNSEGQTPEFIMYGIDLETIPVKTFHTLFCPVYVLDHRLQSAGGPGPPKWEPRSCIGVYLGHSPFHAGSIALVFNPKTAQVSPQYHIVFDDDFSNVPYMERGEVPPNWDDLCCLSAESATDESVDLAFEWMSGQQIDADENGDLIPKVKHKAHMTYGARAKQFLGMFALICTVNTYSMSSHRELQNPSFTALLLRRIDEANEHCDGTLNEFHFISLLTDTSSNEVFSYHQAQKQDDWIQFVEAMEKEVEDHEGRGHWILVPCSTIPSGNKPIKATWSFKRKRFPDGCLNKHKARLCAHGGMQRWGENYWETYSPVVNMISIKLLLEIAKNHGLKSKLIDFVLAFLQADLDIDIWMELPIGFQTIKDPDHSHLYVLKLKKNLYGLKQASFNWYKKLRDGLKDRGFKPSKLDQCLYMKDGMVILVYVNDCIILGKDMGEIDGFMKSMQ